MARRSGAHQGYSFFLMQLLLGVMATITMAEPLVVMDPPHPSRTGETVILLHPPLPLVGVSIVMETGCQQNDSLVRGYTTPGRACELHPV